MIRFIKTALFLLLIANLLACNGEGAKDHTTDGGSTGADVVIGKLLGFRDNICTIEGKDAIRFNEDSEVVTVVLLRPAETLPTRSSLSPEGNVRAGHLAKVFVLSGIEQIYGIGNDGLQTGMMSSKSNYCSHGILTDEGPEQLASFLLKNYKGKKLMVIGNSNMMTNALNYLAGQAKYTMPKDEYDHVFIARVKDVGDAEVYHFKY